ncbi:hypothetical protein O3P69_012058 [Scylla paramamosain]|uniref:DRBM domain-containing protein n=1 Tax=Scylla paramamosain TaxID=85552 RepID=A0AAW0SGF1_SCYPA
MRLGIKVKVNRKKVPGAKNFKIRRYVQPKNAVVCLNELRPGVTYTTEQEGGVCQPFCISVEVDGQKYRGFGSSKQLAKQAAAEAALIGFLKPPVTTPENRQDPLGHPGADGLAQEGFHTCNVRATQSLTHCYLTLQSWGMAAPQRPSRRRVPRQLPSRRPSVPTWEAVPPINTLAVDPKGVVVVLLLLLHGRCVAQARQVKV